MRYDVSKRTAPEMPNLGKGTECIKLLTYSSFCRLKYTIL